jgi:hypothetical protein
MISILCIFIAALFSAVSDTLQANFSNSIFKNLNPTFWNPAVSWVNKWKAGSTSIEKFWGSSTVFVFLTDGFHLAKELSIIFICLAVANHTQVTKTFFPELIHFLIYFITWGISFQVFWQIFNKKPVGGNILPPQ